MLELHPELQPHGVAEIKHIETQVQSHLLGRVRDFRLEVHGPGLILLGYARTFYAKQLALRLVVERTSLPILANDIHVV